ncbi:MAG: magnesium-translocating P-type ATPase [Kiritimatiellae bacterium]|nr:magnesium-translocating P-type ATPase [Kiritimatiellia bacterium]
MEFCALSPAEAMARLEVSEQGLDAAEAEARLAKYGRNEITITKRGPLADILHRCRNPLVIQLLIIAAVSLAMGDVKAAIVVSGMVVLSVGLSYFQESRSARAVEKLKGMIHSRAVVIREGREQEIALAEVVPGDLVVLQAGTLIPADVRVVRAKDLYVSQSTLTGESLPVEKRVEDNPVTRGSILDNEAACFQGTNVVSGTGLGLVVNTGDHTLFGATARRLSESAVETSFDQGIRDFTWLMVRFMTVMVVIVFLLIGLTKGSWIEALLFGLAVAVGLTPEMLPMIVTVNLSKGAVSLSKKKVIVKRLSSIQNFGAIDILCTDKTGTLTQDRVVLERHVDVTGRPSEDVLRYAYLNSYYQTGLRNLLDRAVLAHAELDVERTCRKLDEIPFDFQRRRMSVTVEYEGVPVLICKGAVEEILKVCSHYQLDGEVYPILDMLREDLLEEVARLNAEGFRVLAIAYREFPPDKQKFSLADENDLVLLGYIAFYDPPKDSAGEAIKALYNSGVRVKVLTGDNAAVARKIAGDVGLKVEKIVSGSDLDGLSEDQIAELAETADVFAKLTPAQKETLIHALRRKGHVVGFLGDGINDAPALKAADVGISVDSGVDVAKEAADIVLLEKSLTVLENGIVEGRRVFCNIIKYIRMGASSNFGNMFSVVGAAWFLPFLPMAPIQILVNNLLYDISQVAIPTDSVDSELLAKPRQWNIRNIKRFMIFIGPISSIFDYATYALMLWVFGCWAYLDPHIGEATKEYYVKLFHTGWFVESLLTQTLIVHIIRTRRIPFLQSRPSLPLALTTLLIMGVGVWLPFSPLADYLGFIPLPRTYWFWLAGFLLSYSVLTHIVKVWFHRRYGVD